jgi:hypothetical protein
LSQTSARGSPQVEIAITLLASSTPVAYQGDYADRKNVDIAHEPEPFRLTVLNDIEKPITSNGRQEVVGLLTHIMANRTQSGSHSWLALQAVDSDDEEEDLARAVRVVQV